MFPILLMILDNVSEIISLVNENDDINICKEESSDVYLMLLFVALIIGIMQLKF
jgi:hypothetical protein